MKEILSVRDSQDDSERYPEKVSLTIYKVEAITWQSPATENRSGQGQRKISYTRQSYISS